MEEVPSKIRIVAGLCIVAVALAGSTVFSIDGADAEPKDKGLPNVQSVEVRADGVEITTYKDLDGKIQRRAKLPTLNADRPTFETTIGEGRNAVHVRSEVTGPGIPPKVASKEPLGGLIANNVVDSNSTYYTTCTTGFDRGPGGLSWVDLQTTWNYNYSVTSNVQNSKQSYGFPPTHWENFSLWVSNVGQPFSYSDLATELWEGVGWLSIQISSDHMWHQVDAWSNCTPHLDLWP